MPLKVLGPVFYDTITKGQMWFKNAKMRDVIYERA